MQKAILPTDSILEDWFAFAGRRTEGADCYLIGAAIPIVGALLARRVSIPLGGGQKYPNVFTLICGKPGDRKSTTIKLVAALARECLPANAFIPASFSPETLFDEYDDERGGRPDKLWIVDEANSVLTDWQKTQSGERNATRFLGYTIVVSSLNHSAVTKKSHRPDRQGAKFRKAPRAFSSVRHSTSPAFRVRPYVRAWLGASFTTSQNGGAATYSKLLQHDPDELGLMAMQFERCLEISGEMVLSPAARQRWNDYQADNRGKMDAANPLAEDLISRLHQLRRRRWQ